MMKKQDYRRGDVFLADLGPNFGSEQGGVRPVLLIQNDVGNKCGPTLIVVPMTSRFWKKSEQPTHCILDGLQFLCGPSIVLAEQIVTIDKQRLIRHLGRVPHAQMGRVDDALRVSLDLQMPEVGPSRTE